MQPKLVYLHIPKTAGTAFIASAKGVYGKDQVVTFGTDANQPVEKYSKAAAEGKIALCGHKAIAFYPKGATNLYCSMLRDPVARIVSLYSYYTRPDSASDERGRLEREREGRMWLQRGIDPDSIVRSIEQSEDFRTLIENQQCAYLSRHARTFDGVLKTIREHNCLIGDSLQSSLMIQYLESFLGWPAHELVKGNVTRAGGHHGILDEEGAIDTISDLCREDQKLYDYVVNEHAGLLESFTSKKHLESLKRHLAAPPLQEESAISRRAFWSQVSLDAQDTLTVVSDRQLAFEVELTNHSETALERSRGDGLFFVVKLIDEQGFPLAFECLRTRFVDSVPAQSSMSQAIRILIPEEFYNRASSIRIGVLEAGNYWVEAYCPERCKQVQLIKA